MSAVEEGNDPGTESGDQHTSQQPPVTKGGLASTAGDDISGGLSMSGVGEPPEEEERDAIDQIVEGGARLGWGGQSNDSEPAAEARRRILPDGDPDQER